MFLECENCGHIISRTVEEMYESDEDYDPCPKCKGNLGWEIVSRPAEESDKTEVTL